MRATAPPPAGRHHGRDAISDKVVLRPSSHETVLRPCLPAASTVRVLSLFVTRYCLLGQDAEPGFRGPQLRLEAAGADAAAAEPSAPHGAFTLRVDTQDLSRSSGPLQARAPCVQACPAVHEFASLAQRQRPRAGAPQSRAPCRVQHGE